MTEDHELPRADTSIDDEELDLEPTEIEPIDSHQREVAQSSDAPEATHFEITSYPADYTIRVLVDKWLSEQLVIPTFQRDYVWKLPQASRLIESFLLGLPVPQVFLYKERATQKLLVIDGQQRLSTLVQFYKGVFDDRRPFRLSGVDPRWQGRNYDSLLEADRFRLDDTPLRSIVIQQVQPNDHSSIYLIFERLNTGGTQLSPMEIRKAVYHGDPFDFLARLNDDPNWRTLIGQPRHDKRLKDIELVLRVLALAAGWRTYVKSMKSFLNRYMETIAAASPGSRDAIANRFSAATALAVRELGQRPFHVRTRLNVAALDGVLGTLVEHVEGVPEASLGQTWNDLRNDESFVPLISYDTSDTDVVKSRFALIQGRLGLS